MEQTPTQTPTHKLADLLLGDDGPLERFVQERRQAKRSWRLLVRDIYEATGGEIDLTYETLRQWFPEEIVNDEERAS